MHEGSAIRDNTMLMSQTSLRNRYETALPFDTFLAGVRTLRELWEAAARRAIVPPEAAAAIARTPGRWHLLVLLEEWCGDGANTVPALARLTHLVPNLELRVLRRDEHLDLMDAHLTAGTRSIPVVMVLDACFRERAWWGPRPTELQQWAQSDGRRLSKEDRYREIRRWYARDRGQTALREIATLIERVGENCATPELPLATAEAR